MKFNIIPSPVMATEKTVEVRLSLGGGNLELSINGYAVIAINPQGKLIRYRNVSETTGLDVDEQGRIKDL